MPTLSFDYDPSTKPSDQIKHMAAVHRPDCPLDRQIMDNALKDSFESVCYQIDSEFIAQNTLRALALQLRCTYEYLAGVHSAHRWHTYGISEARAAKLAKARSEEPKKTNANHRGATTEKRAKNTDSGGIGWGLDGLLVGNEVLDECPAAPS